MGISDGEERGVSFESDHEEVEFSPGAAPREVRNTEGTKRPAVLLKPRVALWKGARSALTTSGRESPSGKGSGAGQGSENEAAAGVASVDRGRGFKPWYQRLKERRKAQGKSNGPAKSKGKGKDKNGNKGKQKGKPRKGSW